jgi:predicted lactoylglutathione lyase
MEEYPLPADVEPSAPLMVEVSVRNLQVSSAFYRRSGFTVVRQDEQGVALRILLYH